MSSGLAAVHKAIVGPGAPAATSTGPAPAKFMGMVVGGDLNAAVDRLVAECSGQTAAAGIAGSPGEALNAAVDRLVKAR